MLALELLMLISLSGMSKSYCERILSSSSSIIERRLTVKTKDYVCYERERLLSVSNATVT